MSKEELKRLSTIMLPDNSDIQENIEYKKKLIEDTAQKIIKGKTSGKLTPEREFSLKNKIYAALNDLDNENYFKKDCNKVFSSVKFHNRYRYYTEEFISDRKFVCVKSADDALRIIVEHILKGKEWTSFWNKFEQRFYFNMKDCVLNLMKEDNGYEEDDYKLGLIKNLFDDIVDRNSYEKTIRKTLKEKIGKISAFNKEKIERFLIDILNGNEIDLKKLRDIFDKDIGMVNMDDPLKVGEDNTFLDVAKEDDINLNTKEDLKNDLLQMLEKAEKLLSSMKNKPLCIYLKALTSINVFQYEREYGYCLDLHDYVDKDFEAYYKSVENKDVKFDDIMADYLNKKVGTVRKYVKTIKEQREELEAIMKLM